MSSSPTRASSAGCASCGAATTSPTAPTDVGHLDAGLFFIAFMRNPGKQFVPMQRALASKDMLNEYIEHNGSAVFACPPGLVGADDDWGSHFSPEMARWRSPMAVALASGITDATVASGFRPRSVTVLGPLGHPVEAVFATRGSTAVVELAQASGLHLLPEPGPSPRTAAAATTYGTGELLVAALEAGAETVVLGLGGSPPTDGGAGMLQALGCSFHDEAGDVLGPGLAHPSTIASADLRGDPRIAKAEIVVATDVDNPLWGPRGAAAVFGPQKGATAEQVRALDLDLQRWSRVLSEAGVSASPEEAAAGAAGGVGFAVLGALGARVRPGVDVVLDIVGFEHVLASACLVVTGEGSLDEQSLRGKAPLGVLRAAQAQRVFRRSSSPAAAPSTRWCSQGQGSRRSTHCRTGNRTWRRASGRPPARCARWGAS